MKLGARAFDFRFEFPTPAEPEWSGLVDRWYQLDAFAYGLAEAWWHWRKTTPDLGVPDVILAASAGASNASDRRFAASPTSAQRFVHTLPNIRLSPLCQVMGWAGLALCVQKDPMTFLAALEEAATFAETRSAWVLAVVADGPAYRVRLVTLRADAKSFPFTLESSDTSNQPMTDTALHAWLDNPAPSDSFPVGPFALRRNA